MYPTFFGGQTVCTKLGACPNKNDTETYAHADPNPEVYVDPNCDPCTSYIDGLVEVLSTEQTILDIIGFLEVS